MKYVWSEFGFNVSSNKECRSGQGEKYGLSGKIILTTGWNQWMDGCMGGWKETRGMGGSKLSIISILNI